jgi:phage terminase large subunit-like protein
MPKPTGPTTNAEAFAVIAQSLKATALRPNIHGYRPHDKQRPFHAADTKARLYIGGNRSGKTTGGIAEDIFWLTGKHPYRITPEPPVRGRIISVDFLNGIEKIIKPELARWLPPSELLGGSWSTAYNKERRTLTLENGSFVEFMSYDQDLDKFAGTSRHFIHFDEEPPQDIWLENKTRLIDTGGSWWITMTPVEGMTWIYDDIYMPGKNDPSSGITVVEVDMTENPYLHQGEVDEFISGLSNDDREARVKGKFVQVGGLIYKHFDPEVHVIDPMVPPREWEWFLGLDHGFSNPTAALWCAVSPDNRVIVFDEHYVSGEVVSYHAQAIHARDAIHKKIPNAYIGDPSIRNTDPITGTSIHLEYLQHGIPILLGNNDVVAGINKVASYLEAKGAGGLPQLLITRNCINLITELQRYRWSTFASKRLAFQNNKKEVAHKKDDHACDALRYIMMSRPDLRGLPMGSNEPPNNPAGFPSGSNPAAPLMVRDLLVARKDNSTDWNIQTSTDEVMGGIW